MYQGTKNSVTFGPSDATMTLFSKPGTVQTGLGALLSQFPFFSISSMIPLPCSPVTRIHSFVHEATETASDAGRRAR